MTTSYNPAARFEIKVWDVEFRKAPKRQLMARVYQPQGPGPFPVLLDVHGGAWHDKDRFANVPMCEAAAKSGMLVVAIDTTLSHEAPYPASVQDVHYGVRWLKHKAREWKGDPSTLGVLGSSSGGHVAQLVGMRPRDPRYAALPLAEAPNLDATVNYIATRSPISDCHARYEHMVKTNRPEMIKKTKMYFDPWESIFEGNPMLILERGEKVTLPPLLIMQGELDTNVPWQISEKIGPDVSRGGRRMRGGDLQGLRAPVDRRAGPADRPRARGPEGVHRAAARRAAQGGVAAEKCRD